MEAHVFKPSMEEQKQVDFLVSDQPGLHNGNPVSRN